MTQVWNACVLNVLLLPSLEMVKRNTPGIAIGGLSGGEEKSMFWNTVTLCTDLLPKSKPRYLMGVGYETSYNY